MKIDQEAALVVVDLQLDFCPGGALAVPHGDKVMVLLNRYIERFQAQGAGIYATRDWHPPNHISFIEQGGIWPSHCVQGTPGASFHLEVHLPTDVEVISKGTDPDREAYSGFQGTDLADRLRKRGVRRLYVGGLATDYCVRSTVLDAIKEGFETYFLEDASRGVDVNSGDVERAVAEMMDAGAKRIRIADL